MFMSDSKKKGSPALMIISKMKSKDGSEPKEEMSEAPSKDGVEQDASIGLKSAAEEMMSAVESKDVSSFMSALDSYLEMKRDQHESSEEPESETM